MAFSTGKDSTSLQELQAKVNDADLVTYYLGVTKIPCVISSPLRQDRRPSFGLYSKDGNKIYWKDLATKEQGGIYDLLALMWHCDLNGVIARVLKDVEHFTNKATVKLQAPCIVNKVGTYDSKIDLQCKVREWRQYDIDYWESYGISIEWLKWADVYPISHKIVIKDGQRYVFGADKYAYAFIERKEGNISIKIYQPYNTKGFKWANKHDRSVISLWSKLPEKGDKVVICSSLKDALCLMANTKIPAIAIQGEGYGMSNTAVNELKRRFTHIYILLDNDEPGKIDAIKLAAATGFKNIVLPEFPNVKDISDYYKSLENKSLFIKTIQNLINSEIEDQDPFDLPF